MPWWWDTERFFDLILASLVTMLVFEVMWRTQKRIDDSGKNTKRSGDKGSPETKP